MTKKYYKKNHKIKATIAIIIIKIRTPNKYLLISGDCEDFFLPAPHKITK